MNAGELDLLQLFGRIT